MKCFKSFNLWTKILRCDHLSKGSSIIVLYSAGLFPFWEERGDNFFEFIFCALLGMEWLMEFWSQRREHWETFFINRSFRNNDWRSVFIFQVWQKINTVPVCFGARNNKYGAFNVTKTGRVKTMKLVHKSGSIHCNQRYGDSYWGCKYHVLSDTKLQTIIKMSTKKPSCQPLKTCTVLRTSRNISTASKGPGTNHWSLFFATFQAHCLCRATRSCRYGMGKTWQTFQKQTIVVKPVWMSMHGTYKQ